MDDYPDMVVGKTYIHISGLIFTVTDVKPSTFVTTVRTEVPMREQFVYFDGGFAILFLANVNEVS